MRDKVLYGKKCLVNNSARIFIQIFAGQNRGKINRVPLSYISRILYLYVQDFLLWVGDIRMATIIGWTTAIMSALVTTIHIADYYLFLNPDELWTYNYCMHLPYVETERRVIQSISCYVRM